MNHYDLKKIQESVTLTAMVIKPLLNTSALHKVRNPYAHIWLGISTTHGDDWRKIATPHSIYLFLDWISKHPNSSYNEYPGPIETLPENHGTLFDSLSTESDTLN